MLTITFYSNFLNHHQTPFCNELYKQLGNKFTFVSTIETPDSFIQSGYPDCRNYPYNLLAFENDRNYSKAMELGLEADVVIIGSAPDAFIVERLHQNKHTFRYSERLFKDSAWLLFNPRVLYSMLKTHSKFRRKNLYMLCASGFAADDLRLIFAYPQKKYRWGYFTEVEYFDIDQLIEHKPKEIIQILWVGRFLDWKHPELAVLLALKLKKRGFIFQLNMIGVGVEFARIKRMIDKFGLSSCISLIQSMPNSDVRNYMLDSNIVLCTSDRNEGWGAVLNEAMSCGCAVVASNLMGAAPFLIKHNKNGMIFKSGSLSSLVLQTEKLLKEESYRNYISKNAYFTMSNEWSPRVASNRFIALANAVIAGHTIRYETGPCSKMI